MAGVNRFSKSIVDLLLELLPLIWEQRGQEKEETCILGIAILRIACIPAAIKEKQCNQNPAPFWEDFSFLGR